MINTHKPNISLTILLVMCFFLTTSPSDGQDLKIMPLGNSITFGEDSSDERKEGPGTSQNCVAYRKALYDLLKAYYTFNFVGSQKSGWAAGLHEDTAYNAGFPGINPKQLTTLLRTGTNPYYGGDCELNNYGGCPQNYLVLFNPDIILLHIGTNGLINNSTAVTYRDSVNAILNIIDAYEQSAGKTVPVFLAQIIKHGLGDVANQYDEFTIYYNDLLYNLVASRPGDKLILVDMENIPGYDYTKGADMFDDYHPNESGYAKMAAKWFAHMQAYNFKAPVVSNIPNITIKENETSKNINLNNYVFDPQDPDNTITWTYTPNPAAHFNISIANGIATITAKNPQWNGNETIVFKASDSGHGSTPLFDTDEVTIYGEAVNDTPVIQGQQPISIQEDSQVTVQFSHLDVIDDNSYPADFTLHVSSGSNYTLVGSYTVKPNSNYYGTLYVPVYVNDGLANSNTYNLMISVTSVNDKPWLNIPSNRTAFEDAQFSMTITSGDVDVGDNLVLSSVNKPAWLSFNSTTGLLRGTPHNNDVGSHSVTIRVYDGTANVDSTFTIEVINTNDNPYIISFPANTTIYASKYFEYFISAGDSDLNDVLSYSAVTIPAFLTFDNATHKLSGTPQKGDTGVYAVSLKVGDGTVFVFQDFNLLVKPEAHAPEITSIHINSAKEDSLYIYALKAKDIDGDILTYSAIKIPDWTDFYPSGILIGTPVNKDVGFHDVVLSVTDGLYTVYDSFNIEVINVNDPPVILGASRILSTPKEIPLELNLNDLLVRDDDNVYPDDFTLVLYGGDNYTAIDHLVIPNAEFIGKLNVALTVDDGMDSASSTIPVNVGLSPVEENSQNKGYLRLVYPVPPKEHIYFAFNFLDEDAIITLYDSSLKPIIMLHIPVQTRELVIDTRELPIGMIFYKIDYKQSYDSGRFIIAR